MGSNPYPYFDDSWNTALIGLAGANVVALLLWIFGGDAVNLGRIGEPSWVPGIGGVILLFIFGACVLASLVLWLNMWMYWSRCGKPLLWMFLLLIGPWGTALAFLFLVYRKDVAAYKHQEEQERMNLTHF